VNIQADLKRLWGQIKRELWEHSMCFKAPLYFIAVGFVLVLALAIATQQRWGVFGKAPDTTATLVINNESFIENKPFSSQLNRASVSEKKALPTVEKLKGRAGYGAQIRAMSLYALTIITIFYAIFCMQYLLTCLYSDRKDGSYLYWRSMPVSETQNVLIKLFMGVGILPLMFFIALLAFLIVMTVVIKLIGSHTSISGSDGLINFGLYRFEFFHIPFLWLSGGLWLSPVAAWLLFASAVARRSPYLVFISPILILYIFQISLFDVNYFSIVFDAYQSAYRELFITEFNGKKFIVKGIAFSQLFSQTYLVILTVSVILISATIWLRNNRHEI
jgi:hypothetical protein